MPYLLFAAIPWTSISVQQSLAFFSELGTKLLGAAIRKCSVWIRHLIFRAPASSALRYWTHSCVGHLVPIHAQ